MFSKFSVKKPYTVLVGVILVLILGFVSYTKMSADLLPNINLPYVVVMTTYIGASPETVETVVTAPVESSMATVSNIENITSMSAENYSVVILEFAQTANMDSASLEIRENLDQLKSYWDDSVGNPIIMKINPDMLPVMIAAVGVTDMDEYEVSEFAEDKIVPQIESIEGVASVTASGLIEQSLHAVVRADKIDEINKKVSDSINAQFEDAYAQIDENIAKIDESISQLDIAVAAGLMDPDSAAATRSELENTRVSLTQARASLDETKESTIESVNMKDILTVDTVSALLSAQNFSMPAGYVSEGTDSYLVRIGDKPDDLEELKSMPLMSLPGSDDEYITLDDVADIFYSDNIDSVYTNVDGKRGIVLSIQKQTGYSTGDVSKLINNKFEELENQYSNVKLVSLMDQGVYIDLIMRTIVENVLWGALLAIIVLIIFLRDIRPTFIIAISIPISIISAVVCMYFSGVTLNIISLSGLALGIGMLVDNSIVVIENIYRLRGQGIGKLEAAVEGAREVSGAIFASTLTTICVFLPIVFTEGITRQLFVDMGLTIAYSLLASLLVALTVVPALASKTLRKVKVVKTRENSVFYRIYSKFLRGCLVIKPLIVLLAIGLLAGSAYLAYTRGTAYFPDMESTQISVTLSLTADSELDEVTDAANTLVERIGTLSDVENVGAMASSTTMSMFTGGQAASGKVKSATLYVTTREDRELNSKELSDKIMEFAADLKGTECSVQTSTMDMSALGGSGITLEIKGRDLDTLYELANEAVGILKETEGIDTVTSDSDDSSVEIRILVDDEKALKKGLTTAQIFSGVYSKLSDPSATTKLTTATNDISVFVEDETNVDITIEDLKNMLIECNGSDGVKDTVKLSEIADFEEANGFSTIHRSAQSRYVTVSATLKDGYNIGLVSADAEKNMEKLEVPKGYSAEFNGENEAIMEALYQLLLMLLLAVAFIYLIMVAQFQSLLSPFIIMFSIPLAFTGGFFALYLTNNELSIIAMIGFVMLSGIIVNNGIVLVDYINQKRAQGMRKKDAIVEASVTRLRPVLMTALTTILALLTMAFSDKMGADMSKPLAIVVIGGMIYGTLMTLVVVPCIYDMFSRDKKKKPEESISQEQSELISESLGEKEETDKKSDDSIPKKQSSVNPYTDIVNSQKGR